MRKMPGEIVSSLLHVVHRQNRNLLNFYEIRNPCAREIFVHLNFRALFLSDFKVFFTFADRTDDHSDGLGRAEDRHQKGCFRPSD